MQTAFQRVNTTITTIEQRLHELDETSIASLIRKLQLAEKEHLLLTSSILLEEMRRDLDPKSDPAVYATTLTALRRQEQSQLEAINSIMEALRYES